MMEEEGRERGERQRERVGTEKDREKRGGERNCERDEGEGGGRGSRRLG